MASVPPADEISKHVNNITHGDTAQRLSAVKALGTLGEWAKRAIPVLVISAVDFDEVVRKAAMHSLNQIDSEWHKYSMIQDAVEPLASKLTSRSTEVQQLASYLLCKIGQPAVAGLMVSLADKQKDAGQFWAARTLGRMKDVAAPAASALVEELTNEHAHVRQAAGEALGEIGTVPEDALPALVLNLSDWHTGVRCSSARCLIRMYPAAKSAVPALFQLLLDRETEVRDAASDALAQIGSSTVPLLKEFLQHQDFRQIQEWLERKVEDLDWQSTKQHISTYMGAGFDMNEFRREPLKAIRNVRWFFRHAIEDEYRMEMAKLEAIRILGKIGPDAKECVDELTEALKDKHSRNRQAAAHTLGNIGPRAEAAIPGLVLALIDPIESVRKEVTRSLPKIDPQWQNNPNVQLTVEKLLEKLKQVGETGKSATDTLLLLGSAAVPGLVQVLSSGDRIQREAAAKTLGLMGIQAQSAIPALEKALEDSHGWVRDAAKQALQRIPEQSDLANPDNNEISGEG